MKIISYGFGNHRVSELVPGGVDLNKETLTLQLTGKMYF